MLSIGDYPQARDSDRLNVQERREIFPGNPDLQRARAYPESDPVTEVKGGRDMLTEISPQGTVTVTYTLTQNPRCMQQKRTEL